MSKPFSMMIHELCSECNKEVGVLIKCDCPCSGKHHSVFRTMDMKFIHLHCSEDNQYLAHHRIYSNGRVDVQVGKVEHHEDGFISFSSNDKVAKIHSVTV